MTTPRILPPEPERIDITDRIYAIKIHRHYAISFPYSKEAVDIMRMGAGAHYCPANGWAMPAHRHEALTNILGKIAEAQKGMPDLTPTGRTIVAAGGTLNACDLMDGKDGPLFVCRMGAVFTGGPGLKKSGQGHLVGQQVQYAWHRPATEAEIEASIALGEKPRDEPSVSH